MWKCRFFPLAKRVFIPPLLWKGMGTVCGWRNFQKQEVKRREKLWKKDSAFVENL